jgi:hypothetical protein
MAIKVGDYVTYRKPANANQMYMGLGGCKVLAILDEPKFENGERAVLLEWQHKGVTEKFHAPFSWLTAE